ncbi:MAG: FAD-binding protein, partial [Pseudomonadota bacterium]
VKRIGLIRSDGEELTLSQDENVDMFAATIGGLGLTGLIIWVEFVLVPVPSLQIDQETIAFQSLEEFFVLARESETSFEHTVAWIDCAAQGQKLGRGIFSRGNWSKEGGAKISERKAIVRMPFPAPGFVLNKWSVGAFNEAYFSLNQRRAGRSVVSYDTFFYPLDAIGAWNLMYGAKGFYQYQSVVPPQDALETTRRMLEVISKSGQGSFLAVLKTFGDVPSPGMLSFPSEGTTLALDFPNRGEKTLNLLGKLDEIVTEAGGRLYPAKDGRMPPPLFWQGFPKADAFTEYVDPGFSSSFWQRMIQERT